MCRYSSGLRAVAEQSDVIKNCFTNARRRCFVQSVPDCRRRRPTLGQCTDVTSRPYTLSRGLPAASRGGSGLSAVHPTGTARPSSTSPAAHSASELQWRQHADHTTSSRVGCQSAGVHRTPCCREPSFGRAHRSRLVAPKKFRCSSAGSWWKSRPRDKKANIIFNCLFIVLCYFFTTFMILSTYHTPF